MKLKVNRCLVKFDDFLSKKKKEKVCWTVTESNLKNLMFLTFDFFILMNVFLILIMKYF